MPLFDVVPAATDVPSVKPKSVLTLPTPSQVLHPVNRSSLLPARPGTAPPPAPDLEVTTLQQGAADLKTAREALAAEREKATPIEQDTPSDAAAEAAQLRARLAELITRVEAKKAKEAGGATPKATTKREEVRERVPVVAAPPSPVQVGQDQFRASQYDAALLTFRGIDAEKLSKDERVLVQYLTAGCLRNLGQLDEAVVLYRAVADSRGDEAVVENANWLLKAIESRRSLQRELTAMREQGQ
jgi:hypothetical protein